MNRIRGAEEYEQQLVARGKACAASRARNALSTSSLTAESSRSVHAPYVYTTADKLETHHWNAFWFSSETERAYACAYARPQQH